MRNRLAVATLVAALTSALGCGDNSRRPGFLDLVADPATETGCRGEPVAAGTSRAKVVDCLDEIPAGLLAAGRIGDVVIENAAVEVVIRSGESGFLFPGTGAGGIVDAARVGGRDGLLELLPLAELNVPHAEQVVVTEAGDDGPATVTVRGSLEPIPLLATVLGIAQVPATIETQYILAPDADTLIIRSRLLANDGSAVAAQVGDLFFFSGPVKAWLPGIGFATDLASTEFVASVGDDVSYGLAYPSSQRSMQFLSLRSVTGALGPNVSAESRQVSDTFERFFIIGNGSGSSVTDRAWELRSHEVGEVRGTSAPDVDILAIDDSDRPTTMARTDASGEFRFALPPGTYELSAVSTERDAAAPSTAVVVAGSSVAADVPAGERGTVRVSVREEGAGAIPARVVLRRGSELRIGYADATGELSVRVPVGLWSVDVSRGVEYDAFNAVDVSVTTEADVALEASLNRVIDTSGWISLDTHLHSEMSLDSSITLENRLLAVAAEGVDVAVSSDHDFVSDYQPAIEALGLGSFVAHRTGVEVSTIALGHFNAWPVEARGDRAAGGAFEWFERPPNDIFSSLRSQDSRPLIQINHPRDSDSGFFDLIGFDRELVSATKDPASLGFPDADLADFNDFNFDAIEVGNDFNPRQFAASFADYLALVASGHPAAATGSSDSHGATAFAGNSRTYVFVGEGNDIPATVDLAVLDDALRARKAVVSQGAFVVAAIEDPATGLPAEPGALVDLSGQSVARIHIRVQAPPWMPLASLAVYRGRQIAESASLDPTATEPLRFDSVIEVPIDAADDFVLVVVRPAGPGDPVLDQPDASFTNPLLYDADGNGAWKGSR